MSKLVELREKQVGARIKASAKRIIDESKYSYADAIEYFAFNVLNKNENEIQRLKHLSHLSTSNIYLEKYPYQ